MLLLYGFTVVLLYPVAFVPKGELELLINRFHLPFLDTYFRYITHLGDGLFMTLVLVGLLLYRYYFALLACISVIIQAIVVSVFKRWLLKGLERPMAFFPAGTKLQFVDGVEVHLYNSFPSGHTITAFAVFLIIYLMWSQRNTFWAITTFCLAFSVAFSRVYLLQHFVIDVFFGAWFGVISVITGIWILDRFLGKETQLNLWNNSLRTTLNRKRV